MKTLKVIFVTSIFAKLLLWVFNYNIIVNNINYDYLINNYMWYSLLGIIFMFLVPFFNNIISKVILSLIFILLPLSNLILEYGNVHIIPILMKLLVFNIILWFFIPFPKKRGKNLNNNKNLLPIKVNAPTFNQPSIQNNLNSYNNNSKITFKSTEAYYRTGYKTGSIKVDAPTDAPIINSFNQPSIKNIQPSTLPELSNITVKPTESDYAAGSFIRYFAGLKLSRTPKIYELDITTYNNINSNYNNSYNTTSLTWLLNGLKNDSYNYGKLASRGVHYRNLNSIEQASTIVGGLYLFITDYTQWWRPTESEYKIGSFTRYFAVLKLLRIPEIYELDIDNYNTINNNYDNFYNTTSCNSYTTTSLTWLLTGPKNDVYDRNLKAIQQASTIIVGLDLFITDYTQWWKPTIMVNAPTDTPNSYNNNSN